MAMAALFEGVHCSLQLRRPAEGVIVLTLVGTDVGELGNAPFHALEEDVTRGAIDLFIDARHGRSASVDVSGDWAMFFRRHRERIRSVHMLVRTTFIRMSAESVRRFAAFEDRMHIHTDPSAFERALGGRVLSS